MNKIKMKEDAEAALIAFSMFEIRQSRKTKRSDSFGSWFWHILFLLEDFWWNVTQSFFPAFLRGAPRQSSMSSYMLPSNGRVGDGGILCREYFNWSRSPTSLMTHSACGDIDTIKTSIPVKDNVHMKEEKNNQCQRKGLRFIAGLWLSLGPEISEWGHPNTLTSLGIYTSQHLGDNNLFFFLTPELLNSSLCSLLPGPGCWFICVIFH